MKRRIIFLFTCFLCVQLYAQRFIPRYTGSYENKIIDEKYYKLCYVVDYKQACWSAYDFSKSPKIIKRIDHFCADEQVENPVVPSDYSNSGYDRGHLTPFYDLSFSIEAAKSTFYMSNMCPQTKALNEQTWRFLEQIPEALSDYGMENIYIVSGPLLEKSPRSYKHISKKNIPVPEYFYKIIYFEKNGDKYVYAFIMENMEKAVKKDECGNFSRWQVTVDDIEKRSGIDFFVELDDVTENELEETRTVIQPFILNKMN